MERNEFVLSYIERKKRISPINLRKASCEVGVFPVVLSSGVQLLAKDVEGPIRDVNGQEEWYDITVVEGSVDCDGIELDQTITVNARHIVCMGTFLDDEEELA